MKNTQNLIIRLCLQTEMMLWIADDLLKQFNKLPIRKRYIFDDALIVSSPEELQYLVAIT